MTRGLFSRGITHGACFHFDMPRLNHWPSYCRFLSGCGLTMYLGKNEWLDEGIILRHLGHPFILGTLSTTTETGGMDLPDTDTSYRISTCSVYFIFSENVSSLSLVFIKITCKNNVIWQFCTRTYLIKQQINVFITLCGVVICQASVVREVVDSSRFEFELDYLGHFIFVSEPTPWAAQVILNNDVMAWRPNAIVIQKVWDKFDIFSQWPAQ